MRRIDEIDSLLSHTYEQTIGIVPRGDQDEYEIQAVIYNQQTAGLFNESVHLRQVPLRRKAHAFGLDILAEHFEERVPGDRYTVLNDFGENWVRRKLEDLQIARIRSWVAIVSPLLSALIAILALVVALRKH